MYLQAQAIAKSSFLVVLNFSLCLLRVLEAYKMGKLFWESTAPNAKFDVSDVNVMGLLKSGNSRTGLFCISFY